MVQVYARQRNVSGVRPVRSLVGFEHVTLDPGETAHVDVSVPAERFGFYKPRDGHVVGSGTYRLDIGSISAVNRRPSTCNALIGDRCRPF